MNDFKFSNEFNGYAKERAEKRYNDYMSEENKKKRDVFFREQAKFNPHYAENICKRYTSEYSPFFELFIGLVSGVYTNEDIEQLKMRDNECLEDYFCRANKALKIKDLMDFEMMKFFEKEWSKSEYIDTFGRPDKISDILNIRRFTDKEKNIYEKKLYKKIKKSGFLKSRWYKEFSDEQKLSDEKPESSSINFIDEEIN